MKCEASLELSMENMLSFEDVAYIKFLRVHHLRCIGRKRVSDNTTECILPVFVYSLVTRDKHASLQYATWKYNNLR